MVQLASKVQLLGELHRPSQLLVQIVEFPAQVVLPAFLYSPLAEDAPKVQIFFLMLCDLRI